MTVMAMSASGAVIADNLKDTQASWSGVESRRANLSVFINLTSPENSPVVDVKNFAAGLKGSDFNLIYAASAVSNTSKKDEARFIVNLPSTAINKDLTLKATFQYPGKDVCSLTADKMVNVTNIDGQTLVTWNIDPVKCTGTMKIDVIKP